MALTVSIALTNQLEYKIRFLLESIKLIVLFTRVYLIGNQRCAILCVKYVGN